MKAITEKIRLLPNESFRLLHWDNNVRDVTAIGTDGTVHPFRGTGDAWHAHSEMELVLITRGSGTRFLGDSIRSFKAPDLVLVGSNLPHHWQGGSSGFSGYAVQFCFGLDHPFWKLRETAELRPLWTNAQRGMHFTGRLTSEITKLLRSMTEQGGTGRLAIFMLILEKLLHTDENGWQYLSRKSFPPAQDRPAFRGIQKVINLLLDAFHEDISFQEVLKASAMSKATFERQFKKHTGKTFTTFLSEVRIDAACRQLIETDLSISEIAFDSGFNNLSHFNHQFQAIHGLSPRAFRRKMRGS